MANRLRGDLLAVLAVAAISGACGPPCGSTSPTWSTTDPAFDAAKVDLAAHLATLKVEGRCVSEVRVWPWSGPTEDGDLGRAGAYDPGTGSVDLWKVSPVGPDFHSHVARHEACHGADHGLGLVDADPVRAARVAAALPDVAGAPREAFAEWCQAGIPSAALVRAAALRCGRGTTAEAAAWVLEAADPDRVPGVRSGLSAPWLRWGVSEGEQIVSVDVEAGSLRVFVDGGPGPFVYVDARSGGQVERGAAPALETQDERPWLLRSLLPGWVWLDATVSASSGAVVGAVEGTARDGWTSTLFVAQSPAGTLSTLETPCIPERTGTFVGWWDDVFVVGLVDAAEVRWALLPE